MSGNCADKSNNTLLALVSLGFDIEVCQALLEKENLSVESAVEKLILHNSREEKTQGKATSSQQPKEEFKCGSVKGEQQISSRVSGTEEQQRIKYDYHRKEAALAEHAAKRRKLQDRLARESILEEIKADRRHCQDVRGQRFAAEEETSQNPHTEPKLDLQPEAKENMGKYHVKVKLPSGQSLSHYFAEENTLADIILFCQERNPDLKDCSILQPYPRREYMGDELLKPLAEFGFCSSILFILVPRHSHGVQENREHFRSPGSSKEVCSIAKECVGADVTTMLSAESPTTLSSRNGDSYANGDQVRTEPAFRGLCDSIMNLREDDQVSNPLEQAVVDPPGGRRLNESCIENSSGPTSDNLEEIQEGYSLHRNTFRGAAERRLQQQLETCSIAQATNKTGLLERIVPSLQTTCADFIALSLAGKKSQMLFSIGKLSSAPAQKVLESLKKRKLLTGKLLNAFLSCKLQCLDLSQYSLTSNEILENARFHKTLTHLNLSLCVLITDHGLGTAVKWLKNLCHVNLGDCIHITDKSLLDLAGLSQLTFLSLNGTKITDNGLLEFLMNCETQVLRDLSLKRTSISESGLTVTRGFPTTRSLLLDETKISRLEFLNSFPKLEVLSLSSTYIKAGVLECIRDNQLPLRRLNLGNTDVSNEGLLHLKGLPLSSLILPGRFKVTNIALGYIQDLPLKSLDLTDFINITDDGLFFIGQMKSLQSLSLSNTKITDSGLHHLSGMTELVDLNLDNSSITEVGLQSMQGLTHLHTLSLTNSNVDGEHLAVLNNFENLTKLNLSRTRVCDDNVKTLKLPFLKSLNLDRTRVSPVVKEALRGCPKLEVLRAGGCERERTRQ